MSTHVLQVPATFPCVAAPTYYNPTTQTRRGRVDDLVQSVQSQSNFDVRPVYVIYNPPADATSAPLLLTSRRWLSSCTLAQSVYVNAFFLKGMKSGKGEY
jgi:hypothetical protein